ncbi:MAG: hypothetical protein U0744_06205 [Gemmataceae bacterium]
MAYHRRRQELGTPPHWRSRCCFAPPVSRSSVGWVVGREELPRAAASAWSFFTDDGGSTWRMMPNTTPGLNQARFASTKFGFLDVDGSDQFPSGLFTLPTAANRGLRFRPHSPAWFAGDFS